MLWCLMHVYAMCKETHYSPRYPIGSIYKQWTAVSSNHRALTILVQVREIDLITKQDNPLAQLYGGHDHSIGGAAILTVVVKGLQEQLWRGSTGEVKTNNLKTGRINSIKRENHK